MVNASHCYCQGGLAFDDAAVQETLVVLASGVSTQAPKPRMRPELSPAHALAQVSYLLSLNTGK